MDTTRKYVSLEERVTQAERIAQENGGLLPRYTRLMHVDPSLAQATLRRPAAFAHIPREANVNRKISDHVQIAEQIAKANGGLLPSYTDLIVLDRRLAGMLRDRPDAFDHIPRAKTVCQQKLLAERVAEAERLARENDGALGCTGAFQRQHNALVLHMRRNPEAFAHIPRKQRQHIPLAEHIAHAERLAAAQPDGRLPARSTLRRDLPSLSEAIRKHRVAFAHIPQVGKRRIDRDEVGIYVQVAERLAAENGGFLPHAGRLRKLNPNVQSTLYRHPELFQHIPQEVRGRNGDLIIVRNPPVAPPVQEEAI